MKWDVTYSEARRFVREITRNEIREGNYRHLRHKNHEPSSKYDSFLSAKVHVGILFCLPEQNGNGCRNLTAGGYQSLISLTGYFNDVRDFKRGIDIEAGLGTRYIVGDKLVEPGVCRLVHDAMEAEKDRYLSLLCKGDYTMFAKMFLRHLDDSVDIAKKNSRKVK